MYNFQQTAELLNMKSGNGAKKRMLKYEDKLKQYLIYDNGVLIGIDEEGIEPLRNVGARRRNYKDTAIKHENELLKQQIESLRKENAYLEKRLEEISGDLQREKAENEALRSSLGFFGNLKYRRLIASKIKP